MTAYRKPGKHLLSGPMGRPICINHGCTKYCTQSDKGRYRPTCSRCHFAAGGWTQKRRRKMKDGSYKKYTYPPMQFAEGVTPFKTGKCCNQDGHLGFPCPMDYEKAPWAIGITELDHKDGDHTNNTPENVQEVCAPCHLEKGKRNGDYRDQNNYIHYKDENGHARYYKIKPESKSNALPI